MKNKLYIVASEISSPDDLLNKKNYTGNYILIYSLLFLVSFLFFAFPVFTVEAKEKIVTELIAGNEIEYADSLISSGNALIETEPDKAFELLKKALDLSEQIGYNRGKVQAHINIGEIYYNRRDFDSAVQNFQFALNIKADDLSDKETAHLNLRYGHALNGAGHTDDAQIQFHNALRTYIANNDTVNIAYLNRTLGILFIRISQYDSSLVYYSTARDYYRALNNMERLGAMINSLGVSYYQLGLYDTALENYQEALKIRKEANDLPGVSRVLNNIGMLYNSTGKRIEAKQHYDEALQIAKDINNIMLIGYSLHNLGDISEAEGNLEAAFDYFTQALECRKEVKERTNIILNLNAIGSVLTKMGKYDEAMRLFNDALDLSNLVSYPAGKATTFKNIGIVHAAVGNRQKAFKAFEQSKNITMITGNFELLKETLHNMMELSETASDYRSAYEYFNQYVTLKDSLSSESSRKNIERLKIIYETEQKEQENEALRSINNKNQALLYRNRLIIILISLLFIMALIFVVIFYVMYKGKKRANLDLEDALLHIKTLSGLLPICASCKKIRDDTGYWQEVEGYISNHSDAHFTHGICPECVEKLYPEVEEIKTTENQNLK